jgi:1-acyl-sn-glycerol-3-phosphate acyltransferase
MPPELPRAGNAFTGWLGRLVLRLLGWRVEGNFPPTPKLVVVVGPHTSAWDLIVALAVKLALRIEAGFLAKHTLFRGPLGWLMRALGGIPVDRSGSHDLVEQMAREFAGRASLVLALAPEGTRGHVDRWKSGFYYIAERAGVPIVPAALDFAARRLRFGAPVQPAGNPEAATAELKRFIDEAGAKRPELA